MSFKLFVFTKNTPRNINSLVLLMIISFIKFLLLWTAAYSQSTDGVVNNRSAQSSSHLEKVRKVNQETITIVTGALESTNARIGSDLSNVLNKKGELRILPVMNDGTLRTIDDILYLKGVDIGIIRADVLDHVFRKSSGLKTKNTIAYIAKLFNEEIHLITKNKFTDIQQLAGKKINFGHFNSGTNITAGNIFSKLQINVSPTFYDHSYALEKLKSNEISGMIVITGKPSTFIKNISHDEEIKFLSIPYNPEFGELYFPSELTNIDYPNLISAQESIQTIASGAIMAVYNWSPDSKRYKKVSRFVKAFFSKFDRFLHSSRHPKWKEVNIAAKTTVLKRFPLVQQILVDYQLLERQKKKRLAQNEKNIKAEFAQYLQNQIKSNKANNLNKSEQEKLFQLFAQWRNSFQAEVMHYWATSGERKALQVLINDFGANGGKWIDTPVKDAAGGQQAIVLRSRILSGNPPHAVQMKGGNIELYGKQGLLADLSEIAQKEGWDNLLVPQVQNIHKYNGKYVAVPLNIHRVDWIWANPDTFRAVGADIPRSWQEFNVVARKMQAKGIIPLAIGGQPYQETTLFEVVLLGLAGVDFYNKTLVELNLDAIKSDQMKAVFDQMRILRGFVDPDYKGRDWNVATKMVMDGKAAIQVMGDWAKGEFLAAGKKPGKDFLCIPAPSNGGYILNSDSFAMFRSEKDDKTQGQNLLAKLMLGEKFQETFNLYKGSIPARSGVRRDAFDDCAKTSMDDLARASREGKVVGSVAHEIAQGAVMRESIMDVVSAHFNSNMSSDEAVRLLAESISRTLR